jgi:preprotein translocase subunit Sec61beta
MATMSPSCSMPSSSGATSFTKNGLLRFFSNGDMIAPSVQPLQLISVAAESPHESCVVLDVQSAVVDEKVTGVQVRPSATYMFALQARRLLKNACSSRCLFLISLSRTRLLCSIFFLFLRVGDGSTCSSRSFRACFFRRASTYVTQVARPFSRMSCSFRNQARSPVQVVRGTVPNDVNLKKSLNWLG